MIALFFMAMSLVDVPELIEVHRFGWTNRAVINDLLVFNRFHNNFLRDARKLYNYQWLSGVIRDNERRYEAWDHLRDAMSEHYKDDRRRQALDSLRKVIGREMFDQGDMPEHVGFHRFIELR